MMKNANIPKPSHKCKCIAMIRPKKAAPKCKAKYKDIKFRGDADYSIAKYKNFTTYVSEPEITNTKQRN